MGILSTEALQELLTETGAVKKGHFKLSSGLHSDTYVQCALLLRQPVHAAAAGRSLASLFSDSGIDTVAAPAVGGLVIGFAVAQALGVPFIFTERGKETGAGMELRRGFIVEPKESILVVEDVVTTGGSAAEAAVLLSGLGARIAGVGSIIKRGQDTKVNEGWRHLIRVDAPAWESSECPLCAQGAPIYYPGSRT